MIPIRDDAPRSTTPFVNYFLIALNVLVFLFQLSLTGRALASFDVTFGLVPARVDAWLSGAPAAPALVPFFSSMFLHADVWHLIFNMWWLAIFGDNVEDHLGHFRYLLFYLATGLVANLTHFIFNLHSPVPAVGASGAIAGVAGAYFLLFPSARVLTWFVFFVFWLPAWLVLGYWFVLQFLSGAAGLLSAVPQSGGIAVWAHVGGFICGLALIKLLPARRQYYSYES
ncbi:MAG TPA: rhomboid family intramembrane serine protease [Verrucomicrobiae bacterium]|jgi:membrane associated rhomboid family serine protease|nr:rhomboid family intramembrane serine protease [Verrucomicrobiae bacterium]